MASSNTRVQANATTFGGTGQGGGKGTVRGHRALRRAGGLLQASTNELETPDVSEEVRTREKPGPDWNFDFALLERTLDEFVSPRYAGSGIPWGMDTGESAAERQVFGYAGTSLLAILAIFGAVFLVPGIREVADENRSASAPAARAIASSEPGGTGYLRKRIDVTVTCTSAKTISSIRSPSDSQTQRIG